MKQIEVKYLSFFPEVQKAKEFLNAYFQENGISDFKQQQLFYGRGSPLGILIVNGSIAGALISKINVNNPDKEGVIYQLVNSEGVFELDSDYINTAINKAEGQNIRKRNLSMTDEDHSFLTQMGAGNTSAGLRVVVEIAKLSRSRFY